MKKLFNFIFYFSFLFLLSIKPSISEEKIKIGLLLPLSGQNSELGKSVLRSVNLAINKIDDPILEVYPKNNYDSPEKNYLAAKELYDSGVRIFIGPIFEKNIKNLEKLNDAIFLTLSNKISKKKNNIIYSGVNAYSQMYAINKFLKKEKIEKTICLILKMFCGICNINQLVILVLKRGLLLKLMKRYLNSFLCFIKVLFAKSI